MVTRILSMQKFKFVVIDYIYISKKPYLEYLMWYPFCTEMTKLQVVHNGQPHEEQFPQPNGKKCVNILIVTHALKHTSKTENDCICMASRPCLACWVWSRESTGTRLHGGGHDVKPNKVEYLHAVCQVKNKNTYCLMSTNFMQVVYTYNVEVIIIITLSFESNFAPFFINNLTTSSCPYPAAICRALSPCYSK